LALYDQLASVQCPLCTCSTETVRRRGSTTLYRCPKCSLEFDYLDPRRRVDPLDPTDLNEKPATKSPLGPPHPTTPRTRKHDPALCPYCGSSKLFERSLDRSSHYAETSCRDCGRHLKFNHGPWSLERALAFELPFGKYRGFKIGELLKTGKGRSYLVWISSNVSGNAGTAARIALSTDPVRPPNSPNTAARDGGESERRA
jgi:transcription elongation factor Elf1